MPEADQTAGPATEESPAAEQADQPAADESEVRASPWSGFGIASAALGLVALAAVALVGVLWSGHRSAEQERAYQARAMQFAAEWTATLINMNADNVETSLQQLRDGTVGELNSGFEASIAPYREVVRTLRSRTAGRVESVSIEELHNRLDGAAPGAGSPAQAVAAEMSSRTDTVLVVATSVSENAGTAAAQEQAERQEPGGDSQAAEPPGPTGPITVRWNLRLGVSEVGGELMISRLESVR